jgi:hypothetical protein
MNLNNYSNIDLANVAISIEDRLLTSNHEVNESYFSILMKQKNLIEIEARRRGLKYSSFLM